MRKHRFKILSLILALIIALLPTANVYATGGGSGTHAGQGEASDNNNTGGPSAAKTGWLCYVADNETNSIISPSVVFFTCGATPPISPIGLRTRVPGGTCTEDWGTVPSYILAPYDSKQHPQGMFVKEYLVKNHGSETGMEQLIEDTWGSGFADKVETYKEPVLCMEGVYWHNIFLNGRNTGKTVIGTAYTLSELYMAIPQLNPFGDSRIRMFTNGLFATSNMCEANCKLRITPPSSRGRISNVQMHNEGYGMKTAW